MEIKQIKAFKAVKSQNVIEKWESMETRLKCKFAESFLTYFEKLVFEARS